LAKNGPDRTPAPISASVCRSRPASAPLFQLCPHRGDSRLDAPHSASRRFATVSISFFQASRSPRLREPSCFTRSALRAHGPTDGGFDRSPLKSFRYPAVRPQNARDRLATASGPQPPDLAFLLFQSGQLLSATFTSRWRSRYRPGVFSRSRSAS